MSPAASRLLFGASGLGLAVLAIWALRPLPMPTLAANLPSVEVTDFAVTPTTQVASLDTRAFSTPLWVAPPALPVPPAPPPPPPPLKLQLIAIVTEPSPDATAGTSPASSIRSVLIYDPDADRMLSLKIGDRIAGRTIEKITEASVTLKDGSHTRTLSLQDAPSAAGGAR